jgi:hypothetical protein
MQKYSLALFLFVFVFFTNEVRVNVWAQTNHLAQPSPALLQRLKRRRLSTSLQSTTPTNTESEVKSPLKKQRQHLHEERMTNSEVSVVWVHTHTFGIVSSNLLLCWLVCGYMIQCDVGAHKAVSIKEQERQLRVQIFERKKTIEQLKKNLQRKKNAEKHHVLSIQSQLTLFFIFVCFNTT